MTLLCYEKKNISEKKMPKKIYLELMDYCMEKTLFEKTRIREYILTRSEKYPKNKFIY